MDRARDDDIPIGVRGHGARGVAVDVAEALRPKRRDTVAVELHYDGVRRADEAEPEPALQAGVRITGRFRTDEWPFAEVDRSGEESRDEHVAVTVEGDAQAFGLRNVKNTGRRIAESPTPQVLATCIETRDEHRGIRFTGGAGASAEIRGSLVIPGRNDVTVRRADDAAPALIRERHFRFAAAEPRAPSGGPAGATRRPGRSSFCLAFIRRVAGIGLGRVEDGVMTCVRRRERRRLVPLVVTAANDLGERADDHGQALPPSHPHAVHSSIPSHPGQAPADTHGRTLGASDRRRGAVLKHLHGWVPAIAVAGGRNRPRFVRRRVHLGRRRCRRSIRRCRSELGIGWVRGSRQGCIEWRRRRDGGSRRIGGFRCDGGLWRIGGFPRRCFQRSGCVRRGGHAAASRCELARGLGSRRRVHPRGRCRSRRHFLWFDEVQSRVASMLRRIRRARSTLDAATPVCAQGNVLRDESDEHSL